MKSLLIVLGNQLFDKSNHPKEITDIFMCEDFDLCTYEKHHKKKIAFLFSAKFYYVGISLKYLPFFVGGVLGSFMDCFCIYKLQIQLK